MPPKLDAEYKFGLNIYHVGIFRTIIINIIDFSIFNRTLMIIMLRRPITLAQLS